MHGANHISQCINKPFGQNAPSMRTCICKGKKFFLVFPDADLFSLPFHDCNMVGSKIYLVKVGSDFGPHDVGGVGGWMFDVDC